MDIVKGVMDTVKEWAHMKTYVACLVLAPMKVDAAVLYLSTRRKAVFDQVLLLDHENKCKEKAMRNQVQTNVTKLALYGFAVSILLCFFYPWLGVFAIVATAVINSTYSSDVKDEITLRCHERDARSHGAN